MLKHLKKKTKEQKEREIYDQFAEEMLALCFRYLGNIMDAEEVMHNGFIKAFDNISKFVKYHENSLKFWIKKIMVNECLMFLRKKKEFKIVAYEDIMENEIIESNIETEDYLSLLNKLPAGYRTVFNLYAIEGYSHKEVAEMLKISESTSRSQLTKARKLLQEGVKKNKSRYA